MGRPRTSVPADSRDEQAAQFDEKAGSSSSRLVGDDVLASVVDEIDRFEAKVDAFFKTQPDERDVDRGVGRGSTFTVHSLRESPLLTEARDVGQP